MIMGKEVNKQEPQAPEATQEELKQVSDDALLKAAEEIVKNEADKIEKSEADLTGSEGAQDLAGSGTQGPAKTISNPGNGTEGGAQDEANSPSNKGDQPTTQTGDAQDTDSANNSSKKKEKDPKGLKKAEDKPSEIDELKALVKSLTDKIDAFEKSATEKKDDLNKSVTSETIEMLAKSYNKQIRELQKANEELSEKTETEKKDLHKSFDELKKSNDELVATLKKPARTRETVDNYSIIKKGNSEVKSKKIFKSKIDALDRLVELQEAGKVSRDEVISFNASGYLSDNARKRLYQ